MRAESKNIPPKANAPSPLGWFAGIFLGATAIGVGALVFFFNPSTHGFYPICLFHELTGWNCPGCGMTRALYALLHGQFLTALRDNALFVFLFVAGTARGAWFGVKQIRHQPTGEFVPLKILWLLLAVALVFTVLRNLPAFSFLSP